jgi:selenocysteine lyase/cysteine desulfurase
MQGIDVENEPQSLTAAHTDFKKAYPDYESTQVLGEMRATEYALLDQKGVVYLDYTGGGLYAGSQIRQHMELLRDGVFGNPHSINAASEAATLWVDRVRAYVLEFFNASPDEYVSIFTSNATAAIKLVGESYPFKSGDRYLLTFDNHNSVNGIREFARSKGATISYVPVIPPELRVDERSLRRQLDQPAPGGRNLFAYPAQSNLSGVQFSLDWIEEAQARGWDVLLDCAAFVPTNRLDLGRWHPDFVTMSFYKMFGYPTGVGCLLARKSALARLSRPWFAGGTITIASVQADAHHLAEGEAAFEEGTVNYLTLPAVEFGLRHIASIGMETIHRRVSCLISWLLRELTVLRHSTGEPLVRVYGPTDMRMRGGNLALNFYDAEGGLVDHRRIETRASQSSICLRTGCFCNPGASEIAHGLSQEEMAEAFKDGERMTLDQFLSILEQKDGQSAGAVRVSLGLASNFADVYGFAQFARSLLDIPAQEI